MGRIQRNFTASAIAAGLVSLLITGPVMSADWPDIRRFVEGGDHVLSLDVRGAGETRMRFRTGPADDPRTAEVDDLAAYASPISGVLANHVYNTLLTGRPYFLEMMEDVEIVARFARQHLGVKRLAVRSRADAGALADAVAASLPGLERLPSEEPVFRWADVVEELRELWPIQYLVPGGGFVDLASAKAPPPPR